MRLTIDTVPMPETFWYLASPYSRYRFGLERAALDVAQIGAQLAGRRIPFYCPIAETHAIARAGDMDPLNADLWLEHDAPLMRAASGLLICQLPGWDTSHGIGVEIDVFLGADKPVCLLFADANMAQQADELRAYRSTGAEAMGLGRKRDPQKPV